MQTKTKVLNDIEYDEDTKTFTYRVYCHSCGHDMGLHSYVSYEKAEFARDVTKHYCQACNTHMR